MDGLKVCSSGDTSVFQMSAEIVEIVVSQDCDLLKLVFRKLHSSGNTIREGVNGLVEKS